MDVIGVVVIGRNEGERLKICLQTLPPGVRVVYVDSGSEDQSREFATAQGAEVVSLDTSEGFTAARARNAGWRRLRELDEQINYVQFVDGDCEIVQSWWQAATDFLLAHPDYAVVCGRRVERYPEASIYNRLCDVEWNTPVGEAQACGGDALMRLSALEAVGGYRDDLIAGEEPELCVRLRLQGYRVFRLDAKMTLHDANMLHFHQWWRRSVRAGYAYANGALLHGFGPEAHWRRETLRALFWGGLPLVLLVLYGLGLRVAVWFGILIYAVQYARLLRASPEKSVAAAWAFFTLLGKFAECVGVLKCVWGYVFRQKATIIEYKR